MNSRTHVPWKEHLMRVQRGSGLPLKDAMQLASTSYIRPRIGDSGKKTNGRRNKVGGGLQCVQKKETTGFTLRCVDTIPVPLPPFGNNTHVMQNGNRRGTPSVSVDSPSVSVDSPSVSVDSPSVSVDYDVSDSDSVHEDPWEVQFREMRYLKTNKYGR